LFLVLACVSIFAQANSDLTGIVTDQSGAVVPGAKIVLTDPLTGSVKTTVSSSTGLFDFGGLNPANYNLKVTAKGFEAFVSKNIVVNVSATVRTDVKLTVGAESQTVTVEADALAVQVDSNMVSNMITAQEISELATENRNLMSLATLGMGVSNNLPDSNAMTSVSSGYSISFNGLNYEHNIYLVDGGEIYDRGGQGRPSVLVSMDAMAEFQVMSSNYPPDYGLASGGTISMAIKSGKSQFHGLAYEEDRNTDFNGKPYFASTRPVINYNIYGFNIGGPAKIPHIYGNGKQKTFFFWNEEWRKTPAPYVEGSLKTLPASDFPTAGSPLVYTTPGFTNPITLLVPKNVGDQAYVAKLKALNLTPGQAFPNSTIPAALFDPNALLYLASGVIPKGTGNDQVTLSGSTPTNARDDVVRIDHSFNDKWQLMAHYLHDSVTQNFAQMMVDWGGGTYPTVGSTLINPSNSGLIKLTGQISQNVLTEITFSYNGNTLDITDGADFNKPAGWSVQPIVPSFAIWRKSFPAMAWNGLYGTSMDSAVDPYHNAAEDYNPRIDLSYTTGKHALKFGFNYNRYTKNQQAWGDEQGNYTFNSLTGDGFMDMVLGLSGSYSQNQTAPIFHYVNQSPGVYAMDNWHVTPRLTLQLGLRYDALPHAYERTNSLSNFDPTTYSTGMLPAWGMTSGSLDGTITSTSPGVTTLGGLGYYTNGLVFPGKNGVPVGLVKNDFKTLQPRFGFSEDLFGNGRTVIRGGIGEFFERLQGNDTYNLTDDTFLPAINNNNAYLTNPGTNWLTGSSFSLTQVPITPQGPQSLNGHAYRAPAEMTYSLGVQHEIAPSVIGLIQYVGNLGWHQNADVNINNFPISIDMNIRCNSGDPNAMSGGSCPAGNGSLTGIYAPSNYAKGGAPVPLPGSPIYNTYQGWGNIQEYQNTQTANYSGLQAGLKIQKRWGLSGEADYTYSHQIDSINANQGNQDLDDVSNPWNLKADKGSGGLDRRHMFSANYVYQIPFLAKQKDLMHTIAGGWEIAGTFIDETGLISPPSLSMPNSINTVGLGGNYTVRPNITKKMTYNRTKGNWFDTTAFSAPTPVWMGGANQGFGNASKDAIVGPGRVNFTTSLYKNFEITERVKFELKFESFNTFNHTEWQNINTNYNPNGNAAFGTVTSSWDPRSLQLGGRIAF
jgi:hypothetical protein